MDINRTWVTLIPKVDDAKDLMDFRPISMVGFLYKIIAKVLARRLEVVVPKLVGETQLAFMMNRQIIDSALIANEVIWWVKKKRKPTALLKLDFRKAFDSIK